MGENPRFPELADLCQDLSQDEFVWLLGWNIADGRWSRIGLEQTPGRQFLLDLFSKLHGDPLEAAENSRGRLQQRLMALRRGTFEEIQQESPFSQQAQRNMETLMGTWLVEGEVGFARAWEQIFQPGWEAAREPQKPVQIVGSIGDCEERPLEVKGAADRATRVAAEWWYLYYTFGRGWTPGMHCTTLPNEHGTRFSVHEVRVLPETRKLVYFRLPW